MMIGQCADALCAGPADLVGLAIAFAARNSAVYFTKWYPRIPESEIRKLTALPGS